MNITTEQMDAIVVDGISFMRSITEIYGSEKGMEVWDKIVNTLDPEIKGNIFFAMLTGTHESRITLSGFYTNANKIACIKIIRQYTGMSLTEAKNAYELSEFNPVSIKIDAKKRREVVEELRQSGMRIN